MADLDRLHAQMVVGNMISGQWEKNPPDFGEWIRALHGCARLYELAASHLEGDEPDFREALACLRPAIASGSEIVHRASLGYAISGQALEDLMDNTQANLRRFEAEEEPAND